MVKFDRLIRTTLGEFLAKPTYTGPGIYIIACYPSLGCLYIGISENIYERLLGHLDDPEDNMANFIRNTMGDSCGFRLDILTCPEIELFEEWLIESERKLIQYFHPTFNTSGLGEQNE